MKIYKMAEACVYLGVCPTTLRKLSKNNEIKSFTTSGGHLRYKQSDLDAHMGIKTHTKEELEATIEEIKSLIIPYISKKDVDGIKSIDNPNVPRDTQNNERK